MKSNDTSEIIELNVGGCTYTTSRTTILSWPDSMLSRMISGQIPNATDSKKRIFIDRDGPLFRHILNFLRDKRLNLPENFAEYAQLRQEADFYRIEPIINQLDCLFSNKLNLKYSSRSGSLTSLVSTTSTTTTNNGPENISKGLYFTLVSKLYQGSIVSLIGCIRTLSVLSSLDANSRRFLNYLLNNSNGNASSASSSSNNTSNTNTSPSIKIDCFVCECKFMHEEKLICCKPCGLNSPTDAKLVNLSQSIVRLAKRCGLTTSYWEDMFYLSLDSSVPNREHLCSILTEKYAGKLMTSTVCDHRSSYEENTNCTLIERWHIADISSLRN